MADYQLNQPGPTVQQAIDKALEIEQELQQEATARQNGDAARATTAALDAEIARAQAAEALLASITSLAAEVQRAQGAEAALNALISAIRELIPIQASTNNQLADKAFVNSSISSSTAHLVTNNGQPFTSVSALQQVTATENDYAYVVVSGAGGTYYDRYKYSGGQWVLEYRVNSTVFTSAQWAAVNSGATSQLILKLIGLPDNIVPITAEDIDEICV